MGKRLKRDRLAHENRIIKNSSHQDYSWKQITNKYKNTCSVCNRSIDVGDIILWHKEEKQVMHLPEMCAFLGIRKKMPKRRKNIIENAFPVEVRYVNG